MPMSPEGSVQLGRTMVWKCHWRCQLRQNCVCRLLVESLSPRSFFSKFKATFISASNSVLFMRHGSAYTDSKGRILAKFLQYHCLRLPVYQVLTKLAGYPYVGLLPAVRPIPPYICADFVSPGYFMGWNSFGWGAVNRIQKMRHNSISTSIGSTLDTWPTCRTHSVKILTGDSVAGVIVVNEIFFGILAPVAVWKLRASNNMVSERSLMRNNIAKRRATALINQPTIISHVHDESRSKSFWLSCALISWLNK